jgi:alpha-beta hydrolase superfamily lysophospholipase
MTTFALLSILLIQPLATAPAAERVTITTAAGTMLAGRFRDAGPEAPGVLFFPMCREDAGSGWEPVADRLQALGISTLTIAARGTAEAVGPPPAGDPRTADADAAFDYLRSRLGPRANIAVAGSSCGVYLSLVTASRHADGVRAAVALTGPYTEALLDHVRRTPRLAVFAGAAARDGPAAAWARELGAASANPASQVTIADGEAHGTDIFASNPGYAAGIAAWLADRLVSRSAARR